MGGFCYRIHTTYETSFYQIYTTITDYVFSSFFLTVMAPYFFAKQAKRSVVLVCCVIS